MELKPLGLAAAELPDEVLEATVEAVAPQDPILSLPFAEITPVALVMQWLNECEASAPAPSQMAFQLHLRGQVDRLRELLG